MQFYFEFATLVEKKGVKFATLVEKKGFKFSNNALNFIYYLRIFFMKLSEEKIE